MDKEKKINKFKILFKEERTILQRLIISAIVSLMSIFTFIVFGPYELFISNMDYLSFMFKDIVWVIAGIGVVAFIALTGFCMIFRGRIFDLVITIIFGGVVCGYIQGNFLNLNLGSLNGDPITWENYSTHTIVNVFVWFLIFCIPFIVYYFSRKIWTRVIKFGSFLIVAVQAVALVSLLLTTRFTNLDPAYLSTENIYRLSSKENVVVFILDRFDNRYIPQILEEDPNYLKPLNGFTYYRNMVGSYVRTYPSMAYLLTGEKTRYEKPFSEYLYESHKNATFLKDIRSKDYEANLFVQVRYSVGNPTNFDGAVDNLKYAERTVYPKSLAKGMLQLSAYRYSPHGLKASFWMYTGEFDEYVKIKAEDGEYKQNDSRFYKNLKDNKITVQDDKNCFVMYHLAGAHSPYRLDRNANVMKDQTSAVEQGMGSLHIVYEYLQQMKDLGIYDSSTIIITADHGVTFWDTELRETTNPIFFMKPAGVGSDTEMKISEAQISQEDFQSTIINQIGGDTGKYSGKPVGLVREDETRERFFWISCAPKGAPTIDEKIKIYRILGDANDFSNWEEYEEFEVKYPFYKD